MGVTFEPFGASVPRFFLYGEPLRQPEERFVHIERIADRSRQNDWTISPHIHPDLHHVLLLLDGHAEMRTDEVSRAHSAPALLIVPAGVAHAFKFRPETFGYVITVADSYVASLCTQDRSFGRLFETARGIPLTYEDVEEYALQTSAEALLEELRSKQAAHAVLVAARAQVVLAQAACIAGKHEDAGAPERPLPECRAAGTVEHFRRLIELHFRENWPLERYAKAMRISMARLRAACGKVTGTTSIKLLHERIIREAKRDLMFTTKTVAQIAYELGFVDCAYFSRFFRARTGMTPSEFRDSSRSPRDTGSVRVRMGQNVTA